MARSPILFAVAALAAVLMGACSDHAEPAAVDRGATGPRATSPADRDDGGRTGREPRADREGRPVQAGAERTAPQHTGPAAAAPAVPKEFHGLWASDPDACADAGEPSRLRIAAGALEFHESAGRVTGVSPDGVDVHIEMDLTGEGTTREATYAFRLTDAGLVLVDVGSGFARQRCP